MNAIRLLSGVVEWSRRDPDEQRGVLRFAYSTTLAVVTVAWARLCDDSIAGFVYCNPIRSVDITLHQYCKVHRSQGL
jgi:hypothetical protein